ncbi:MAG: hypothetical protein HYT27_03950, partial [Parcubacteria group bacterium]|nr:hypothetical protein [Parcubacteria group bacterium]
MKNSKKTKIIVTLGPSTKTEQDLRTIKDRGVDFVRVNMSHSTLKDQEYFMQLAEKVGIPFMLDTEGSQIRNGDISDGKIFINEGDEMRLYGKSIVGDKTKISLRPASVVSQLEEGDLIYIDFNSLVLRVLDVSTLKNGYVLAHAVTSGHIGANKAVIIDSATHRKYNLPSLSLKDEKAIHIAKEHGVGYMAFSFARNGKDVCEAREKSGMRIIAKIECIDALQNLDEIIKEADAILIDRGDLSKEIPIEKVLFAQKIIIDKARKAGKEVYVATNLLESMVEKREPTRAEIHDIIATILDGASGLALAAETAIGKYPVEAINTLNKVIRHTQSVVDGGGEKSVVEHLSQNGYLVGKHTSALLIDPHGGVLVDRTAQNIPANISSLSRISLTDEQYMDVEQIAIGTFSPIEGFMGKDDLRSVLLEMRLAPRPGSLQGPDGPSGPRTAGQANGVVWPMPIVFDIDEERAAELRVGNDILLTDTAGDAVALLHLEEKYPYDKNEFAKHLFGTIDEKHPGVRVA